MLSSVGFVIVCFIYPRLGAREAEIQKHQQAKRKKIPQEKPTFSSQRTRRAEAYQDRKLLCNTYSALAKHYRKNWRPISVCKSWVGSLDFHPYQAVMRYPKSSAGVVLMGTLQGTWSSMLHLAITRHHPSFLPTQGQRSSGKIDDLNKIQSLTT